MASPTTEHAHSPVAEYVRRLGGTRVIEKVLIANNGIAAVKAIRSIRQWAYRTFGNERQIQFVVMATPEDLRANAEYIRLADQFEEVPGGPNNNNYANVELIVDIAERTGAHAVWAGWGHASENPKLPEALSKTRDNIVFIGPPAKAMRDLGDKICATLLAQSANVSTAPWSGSGLTVDYAACGGIPDEIFRKATVSSVDDALAVASKIGYPVMLKASEGGGGKGIRKVGDSEQLAAAFRQVRGEVPGSPLFVMKLIDHCHHLEVQVVADVYGEAISLYGRDCTVQRRHQKIIEEGPVLVAPPAVWSEMERGAVRLAKLVGYSGVGTVEYLYHDGRYYFLELNPRLQVEHPVTEQITAVNLPATQLNIAMGIPLARIPDIARFYGLEPLPSFLPASLAPFAPSRAVVPTTAGQPDLSQLTRQPPRGHVIAVRVTAENPDKGFQPTSGRIHELTFRSTPNVWGYFSVGASGGLHEYADSQFGHLFAWGATREDARKSMVLALKEVSIRGDIRTPVELLIHLLETATFQELTAVTTGWLDGLIQSGTLAAAQKPDRFLVVVCGGLYKAHALAHARTAQFVSCLEKGQTPPADLLRHDDELELIYDGYKYRLVVARLGPSRMRVALRNRRIVVEAEVRPLADGGLLLLVDGKSHVAYGKDEPTGLKLHVDGRTCLFARDYDPTQLRSTTPGRLVRFLVDDGAHVVPGTPYAEVEVMKMYLSLTAQEAGTIRWAKAPGSVLAAGDLLATVVLDDPSKAKTIAVFEGDLPAMRPPRAAEHKPHQQLRSCLSALHDCLQGYPNPALAALVASLCRLLRDPLLPFLECHDRLAVLAGRLPSAVDERVAALLHDYKRAATNDAASAVFPADAIRRAVAEYEPRVPPAELDAYRQHTADLLSVVDKFAAGLAGYRRGVVAGLLSEYIEGERPFQDRGREEVLLDLRAAHRENLQRVVDIAFAHAMLPAKNAAVLALLDALPVLAPAVEPGGVDTKVHDDLIPVLTLLAGLHGPGNQDVALRARQQLLRNQLPSFAQRRESVADWLRHVMAAPSDSERIQRLAGLVDSSAAVFDVLIRLFDDAAVRRVAMEAYVRRAYRVYDIHDLAVNESRVDTHRSLLFAEWRFSIPELSELVEPNAAEHNAAVDSANSTLTSLRRKGSVLLPAESLDNLASGLADGRGRPLCRYGFMVGFVDHADMEQHFPAMTQLYRPDHTALAVAKGAPPEPINVLNVAFTSTVSTPPGEAFDEAGLIERLRGFLLHYADWLRAAGVRRVTFIFPVTDGIFPRCYTFRERLEFREDPIVRHVEPPLAFHLEYPRLSRYDVRRIPLEHSQQLHVFFAEEAGKPPEDPTRDRRFFVRAIVRQGGDVLAGERPGNGNGRNGHGGNGSLLVSEGENVFAKALAALEMAAASSPAYSGAANHHIFLKFIPELHVDPAAVDGIIKQLSDRYGRRLWRAKVGQVEVAVRVRKPNQPRADPLRFVATNPTGHALVVDSYVEVKHVPANASRPVALLSSLSPRGPLDGCEVHAPYPVSSPVERKRFAAQQNKTTYVYDFPALFGVALEAVWKRHVADRPGVAMPQTLAVFHELVLDGGSLKEVDRPAGRNTIGMVAWRAELWTPEAWPACREIVVIANDITFLIGSFGPKEDELFAAATRLARERGIPRLYIAANSGARIGLATEVMDKFRVAWKNPEDPSKGFDYLYLTDDDYQQLTGSVHAEREPQPDGTVRWRLVDIIGREDGLGVENLRGSGMIAGETSRAYADTFTVTLVTGRSVGIGAYLARLGQRTIQNESAPLILTGAPALNKVLGREVYTSNAQLGGPQIMFTNGVSHLSVGDDLKGVAAFLGWLAYVPLQRDLRLVGPTVDPVERDIEFAPQEDVPYDPRLLITGRDDGHRWLSGFADKDSFMETLAGWGRTVVCGRARLGGIPLGIIAVETRTIERVTPADPANATSEQVVEPQAGQVWFPDSAYKTAQALRDFNHGEQLPVMIFANWRGFSGGMKDMFDEILKFGSYIVDALVEYQQPVFIYLPPCGELRGGAWVVVDPQINPEVMEMYAAPNCRGGVLEPSGTVEIKFRQKELLKTIHRLDDVLRRIDAQLKSPSLSNSEREALVAQQRQRENDLMPIYHQIALKYADLHDTPGRMKAKQTISAIVPWKRARPFFYFRLRRRLAEDALRKRIRTANPAITHAQATQYCKEWFLQSKCAGTGEDAWCDDKAVIQWLEGDEAGIEARLQALRKEHIQQQVMAMAREDISSIIAGLQEALKSADPAVRAATLAQLKPLLKIDS